MPIVSGDIEYRLSGGAANTDSDLALGGAMSTVGGGVITTAVLHNLFDPVSGAEGDVGDTEYRGIYIQNSHGSVTLSNISIWIQTVSPSTDSVCAIALADEAKNTTIETIADESTAPSGPTFAELVSKGTGLDPGDLDFGDYRGLWIRRIISASATALIPDIALSLIRFCVSSSRS